MKTHFLRASLLAAACMAAGAADDAAVLRCRAMPDAAARLACYDALPTTPAAPAAAVAAAVAVAAPAQRFGFERKDELAEIASHIPGEFIGWGPRTRFALANGQVWQVSDESSGVYALRDPKVTIRRAAISGFEMDIEGVKRVPRVRRLD
jgi:hypothetical protein